MTWIMCTYILGILCTKFYYISGFYCISSCYLNHFNKFQFQTTIKLLQKEQPRENCFRFLFPKSCKIDYCMYLDRDIILHAVSAKMIVTGELSDMQKGVVCCVMQACIIS